MVENQSVSEYCPLCIFNFSYSLTRLFHHSLLFFISRYDHLAFTVSLLFFHLACSLLLIQSSLPHSFLHIKLTIIFIFPQLSWCVLFFFSLLFLNVLLTSRSLPHSLVPSFQRHFHSAALINWQSFWSPIYPSVIQKVHHTISLSHLFLLLSSLQYSCSLFFFPSPIHSRAYLTINHLVRTSVPLSLETCSSPAIHSPAHYQSLSAGNKKPPSGLVSLSCTTVALH